MEVKSIEYSIIIPHHNIPNLLKRCLDSIPERTDVQVIVVDDHSNDDVITILKQLEKENPLYSFVYLENNCGGGKARNIGLSLAKGRFVFFADADDFFNNCFDDILDEYRNTDYDIVFFKGNSVDTDTFEITHRANHLNKYIDDFFAGKDPKCLQLRYKFGEPWSKMIKTALITDNSIFFDETKIHNDTTFSYKVGFWGKQIKVDSRALYCVTTRKNSVSVTTSDDRILTRVYVFGKEELFFHDNHIEVPVNDHYTQIVRLLVHGKFHLVRESYRVLHNLGFSRTHVFKETFLTFFEIVIKKKD